MRKLPLLFILVTLLGAIVSCHHDRGTMAPFGWTPVDHKFDSLTHLCDMLYMDQSYNDTMDSAVEEMRRIADRNPGNAVVRQRAMYWVGRLTFTKGEFDSGLNIMRRALALTDSDRYPYDYKRIAWNIDMDYHEPTEERYRQLLSDYDFFRDADDKVIAGALAMELGMFLVDLGAIDEGEPYLDIADTLFMQAGFPEQVYNNRINHANTLRARGDTLATERYMRRMLADTTAPLSEYARSLVLGNLYALVEDTIALRKAYELAMQHHNDMDGQFLYSAFMADEALKVGNVPAATRYLSQSRQRLQDCEEPQHLLDFYRTEYKYYKHVGRVDSALKYLELASTLNDSILTSTNREDVRNSVLVGRIRMMRERAELQRRNSILLVVSIAIGCLLLLGTVCVVIWRRYQRQRMAEMQAQLDLEQSNRKILAMELVIKEKNQLFDSVEQEMNRITEIGGAEGKAAVRIECSLKAYNGMKAHRDNFLETFDKLHPQFQTELRRRYPSLTDTDLRLATYITLGLENKHIASVMGIRPESVKQARWRLRSKLGLEKSQSLAEFLQQFSETK